MKNLSGEQAYLAMFAFLEQRFELTGSDDLGGLLGEMSFTADGSTADPALWSDWCAAIEKALDGKVDVAMKLR